MPQMVGGEVLARMLAAEGVEVVFGIVDGTYMGFFGSFEKHGIRLVSPRHETSAAHMAGAYARLTGKLGVCMASTGPGVANILPGVAVENGEGNRVLLITSSRRSPIAYPDRGGTYQYFDQTGVTRPMTKWSGSVPSFERLPELVRRAARISWSGRPGVVHLDVPEAIMNGVFDDRRHRPPPAARAYRRTEPVGPVRRPGPASGRAAPRLPNGPHIHAGSGVLHAGGVGRAPGGGRGARAPVTTSWAGRGALADDHPQLLPIWAMEPVNQARSEADVVLVVGSRLGETDWWGKPPYWGEPDRQTDDPGGHRRRDPRPEQGRRPGRPGRRRSASWRRWPPSSAATPPGRRAARAHRDRTTELADAAAQVRAELDLALLSADSPMHSSHVPTVVPAGVRRRRGLRVRRRQRRGLGQLLLRDQPARRPALDLQVRDAGRRRRRRRWAGRSPGPTPASCASSATGRWGSTCRSSRPRCATTCP